jgi:hypothetical protein
MSKDFCQTRVRRAVIDKDSVAALSRDPRVAHEASGAGERRWSGGTRGTNAGLTGRIHPPNGSGESARPIPPLRTALP